MSNPPPHEAPEPESGFDNTIGNVLKKTSHGIEYHDARDNELIDNSAKGDGWHGYNLMLDPSSELPKLTATHAQEFVVNLSRDKFLHQYLEGTSRQRLHSKAINLRRLPIARRA